MAFVAATSAIAAISVTQPVATRRPLDDKLAELKRDASIPARILLRKDRYARRLFTDPAEILSAEPRGVSFEDRTRIHIGFPQPDPADRVGCDQISREGLAVILIAGQSNAENATRSDDLYRPKSRFYNLNIEDGGCYVAREHALGTTGHGSAFALPLADELLARGLYANVLIVPIAIGGTFIEEWRPDGGRYFQRFRRALDMLARDGLAPTLMLWQQGEGNASPFSRNITFGVFGDGTNHRAVVATPALKAAARLNYENRFYAIVAGLRELGMRAPVFAAVATICGSHSDPTIRAAQASLPDARWDVYAGPDTDQISDRYDLCHFNSSGIQLVAHGWADVIARHLRPPPPDLLVAAAPEH